MKQWLLAAAFSCTSLISLAQKVEVDGDKIRVDGADYALIEKDGCRAIDPTCVYYIKTLSGRKVIAVKQKELKDPDEVSAGNPDGKKLYLEFVFTQQKSKAETAFPITFRLRAIDVAKKVVKAGLMQDGELNEEAASDFVTANGTPYSERRKELTPEVIVIEKK